jgi:hypothetical protein
MAFLRIGFWAYPITNKSPFKDLGGQFMTEAKKEFLRTVKKK